MTAHRPDDGGHRVASGDTLTEVERSGSGFVVSAGVLEKAFGLSETQVKQGMRDGSLMSRCEIGTDEDEGRWRLVFRHMGRTYRLTVDADGRVLSRASFSAPPSGPASA